MADPERGNFLTRALGIETFRGVRRDGLERGWNQVEAAFYASGVTAMYYFFPLSQPIGWRRESAPRISGRRATVLFTIDACSIVAAYGFGVGFKAAYNLGVEVVPDVLRAMRRFKPPAPPSGLDY